VLLILRYFEPNPFVYRHYERFGMIHFGFEPYFSSLPLDGSFGRKYRGFGQVFFRVFMSKIGKIAYFHAEMAAK